MVSGRDRVPLTVVGWFTILSAIATLMHVDLIDAPEYPEQLVLHDKIVAHSAPAPYQYRILQPVLVQTVLNTTQAEADTPTYRFFFLGSYAGIRFVSILAAFTAVFLSLRLTWTEGTATLATTTLAAFIPFTYRYYYFQPTSIMEMAVFGFGLLVVVTRTPAMLPVLVAVGTLNRETTCFVPFAYFLYWWPSLRRTEWAWLAVSAAAWISMFGGLRVLWPASSNLLDVSRCLSINLTLSRGNLDLLAILAPAFLVLFNARRLPRRYLRLALCSVPWLVLHFFTSRWYEIRYHMPVLIWLLPGLVTVFTGQSHNRGSELS